MSEKTPPKPGRFFTNAYFKIAEDAVREYEDIKRIQASKAGEVQLWEIEPDRLGNRYVVVTVNPTPGGVPKLKFLRRVK